MDVSLKVLYISYDGMTDPLGQSQVLPYICGLTGKGHLFTLISCEKKERFNLYRSYIENICQENNIDWQPLIYHKSPPILSTIWDLLKIQKLSYELQEKKLFNIIHCRGYISALIGLAMKRRFRTKFLFDMRGLWADEKVDAGAWNISKPHYKAIYNFFKRKEKEFFLNADHSVSLTYAGKKEIMSWEYMLEKEDNITVIPCCADIDLFNPEDILETDKSHLRRELGISENQIILSYLGSIGTWYMLEEMMDFYLHYKVKFPTAMFLFITHDEHDKIQANAAQRGIKKDIIISPASRDKVALVLSLSHHSIFFIRPTYSKIASSPTKQGEIMAMNIPLICNAGVGDTESIVSKYYAGCVVSSFEKSEYKKQVDKLTMDSINFNSRHGANEYFSLTSGIERYHQIYMSLKAQ